MSAKETLLKYKMQVEESMAQTERCMRCAWRVDCDANDPKTEIHKVLCFWRVCVLMIGRG